MRSNCFDLIRLTNANFEVIAEERQTYCLNRTKNLIFIFFSPHLFSVCQKVSYRTKCLEWYNTHISNRVLSSLFAISICEPYGLDRTAMQIYQTIFLGVDVKARNNKCQTFPTPQPKDFPTREMSKAMHSGCLTASTALLHNSQEAEPYLLRQGRDI